jgi:hypothetical protein
MLNCEKNNTPFVKAEINSRASIEKRFQNISSVLHEHKLPYVKGYLPLSNVGPTNKEKIWQLIQQLQNN